MTTLSGAEGTKTLSERLLGGVVVPAVTVLDASERPDAAAAHPLLAHLASAGMKKLMLFGSNGEGALLDPADAATYAGEVAEMWRRLAGPGGLVFTAAFAAGTGQLLATMEGFVKACNPDAVIGTAPLYFKHAPQAIAGHIAALERLGKPVIAYNVPKYTGNPFTLETVQRLAELGVVGLKDSSGERELVLEAVRLGRESDGAFAVSQGIEGEMAWALENGAVGITPGYSSLAPTLAQHLFEAGHSGDGARALELQASAQSLMKIHSFRPGVPAMKAALATRGLSTLHVSAPLRAYDAEELGRMDRIVSDWMAQHGDDGLSGGG